MATTSKSLNVIPPTKKVPLPDPIQFQINAAILEIEQYLAGLVAGIPTSIDGSMNTHTETLVFEFAGGATQTWRANRPGWVVGVHPSVNVVSVSVNKDAPTTISNGGTTQILNGYVVNDALAASLIRSLRFRVPFAVNDIINVKLTASGLCSVLCEYAD